MCVVTICTEVLLQVVGFVIFCATTSSKNNNNHKCDPVCEKGSYSLSKYPNLIDLTHVCLRLLLVITPTVSPMLGVCIDQMLGFYRTHKSHYGLPNVCNWKGYKTPFRRPGGPGHKCVNHNQ